jgi:hypothetical protein
MGALKHVCKKHDLHHKSDEKDLYPATNSEKRKKGK